jgi:hypothetical protein
MGNVLGWAYLASSKGYDPKTREAMSPDQHTQDLLDRLGGGRDLVLLPGVSRERAIFEEFSFARREAQAEANLAYDAWHVSRTIESYAVYRAAQDRADAAQDALARWVASMNRASLAA